MNRKTNKTPTRTKKNRLASLDLSIRSWAAKAETAPDAGLADLYRRDAEDLQAIRDAYERGDLDSARSMIDSLDTLVRDQIPVHLYHELFPTR